MIYEIKATNIKTKEVITYNLTGNSVEGFLYYDKIEKKEFHPIEISNNIIREINCNLLLKNSPIFSLKSGESTEIKTISYNVVINCR